MNKFFQLGVFFIIMSMTFGCVDQDGDVEVTETAVLTGYLFAGIPCDSIRITQTISYSGEDTVALPIENIDVTITDGTDTYDMQTDGSGYFRNTDLVIESEKNYEVAFAYKDYIVSAQTFIPSKRVVSISPTYIEMEEQTSGFPGGGPSMPDPIEVTWENEEGDYYYVVVLNIEEDPEYINDFYEEQDSLFQNFRFISEPSVTDYYQIDPRREIRQFGTHRVIVFRVNPEYASLYNVSSISSLNITEPPGNVENGLGILTGVSSDTSFFEVIKI